MNNSPRRKSNRKRKVSVYTVMHSLCSDAVVLHVASMILESMWAISMKRQTRLSKRSWLMLIYLASVPAATRWEMKEYLQKFHGMTEGKYHNFYCQQLLRRKLAETVVYEGLNKGRSFIRITDDGKKLVRMILDMNIPRSVRDFLVYQKNPKKKKKGIAYYPSPKK